MFAETALISNTQGVPEKRSLTGASNNMRKLLKSFKRIFKNSKVVKEMPIPTPILHTCHTEEEHQNWLNEQLEAKIISLQH
ncbi:uncharacterized protein LOC110176295 [Drosophila serrata]|uniref:uncharacterized protein LOC110176295 n=1 Tax=Drosophila serrata TaxID=7274 RepID=UPI000A1D207E|nr:uncharacterized protein LOC110176295 [Drosophila serrata]